MSDYTPGSDRESCGCQGGRITSSRLSFAILYETPAAGAVISVYMAPAFIMVIALVTYSIPPKAVETRFSLANSGLVSLVLFHSGLVAPSAAPAPPSLPRPLPPQVVGALNQRKISRVHFPLSY